MSDRTLEILKSRRFLPLFVTQFLGAFNDNLFKNALVMLILFRLADAGGTDGEVLVAMSPAASSSCRSSCSRPRPANSPTSTTRRA
jgi:hypothetical protein